MVIWLNDLIMQNEGILFYDSTNYNGEGGDNSFFHSIFQVEETSIKRFSNNDEDGDNDGEGWGDN